MPAGGGHRHELLDVRQEAEVDAQRGDARARLHADIEADSFPTGDAMDQKTADVCYDAYADYVGKSLDESSLTATALTPTSSSWTLGDRTVSCVITSQDGSDLTSSAKGSHA